MLSSFGPSILCKLDVHARRREGRRILRYAYVCIILSKPRNGNSNGSYSAFSRMTILLFRRLLAKEYEGMINEGPI